MGNAKFKKGDENGSRFEMVFDKGHYARHVSIDYLVKHLLENADSSDWATILEVIPFPKQVTKDTLILNVSPTKFLNECRSIRHDPLFWLPYLASWADGKTSLKGVHVPQIYTDCDELNKVLLGPGPGEKPLPLVDRTATFRVLIHGGQDQGRWVQNEVPLYMKMVRDFPPTVPEKDDLMELLRDMVNKAEPVNYDVVKVIFDFAVPRLDIDPLGMLMLGTVNKKPEEIDFGNCATIILANKDAMSKRVFDQDGEDRLLCSAAVHAVTNAALFSRDPLAPLALRVFFEEITWAVPASKEFLARLCSKDDSRSRKVLDSFCGFSLIGFEDETPKNNLYGSFDHALEVVYPPANPSVIAVLTKHHALFQDYLRERYKPLMTSDPAIAKAILESDWYKNADPKQEDRKSDIKRVATDPSFALMSHRAKRHKTEK